MSLKKTLFVGLLACLTLPVWAMTTFDTQFGPYTGKMSLDGQVLSDLRSFVERIWEESPAVQGAQAGVEAARARGEGAGRPLYNPLLELDAERTDINTSSVGISQTVDWGDKRDSRLDVASSEIQMAEAELIATRQRVAVEALGALARYLTAREMHELALSRSRLMKHFADTVQQRYNAGDMRALDVSLARVAYSEALIKEASSEGELAESEAALRAVSGLDLVTWPPLPRELTLPPEKTDEAAIIEMLPELIGLRAQVEAAKARVQLAKRETRPDPTVGIRGGRDGSENLLGLTLEIPLFVRNKFTAEVQAASYEAVQKEHIYRDAYRRARARFNGAFGRYQNMTRAWRAWVSTGRQAFTEQEALLESLWQAGELTATDYLFQAKQNVDTQAAALSLVGEVWQAAIAWLDASGQVVRWLGVTRDVSTSTENSGESK